MTQNIKVYRIDKNYYLFEKLDSTEEIILEIVRQGFKKNKIREKVEISNFTQKKQDSLSYYLFVHNFPEKNSNWEKILPSDLTYNLEFKTLSISLLLFIDNGIDIFVAVGGKGYQMIVPFIDHTFGLTVLSKIIKPKEDLIISIESRGLTGTRSGMSEQFRDNFRVMDFGKFGKVPIKIHLTLSENTCNEHFYFLQRKVNERIK